MPLLTTVASPMGRTNILENQVAQATAGQTDWLLVPDWAGYVYVDYNLTAVTQHFPKVDITFKVPDRTTLDSSTGVVNLAAHSAFTQITGAARLLAQIGPDVTGIADDVSTSATGTSTVSLNCTLPPILGIKVLNDITAQSEVQTVTMTSLDPADSFKLTKDAIASSLFVVGVNCAASDLQADLRTQWSDASLTVTGTTDVGPFVITFGTTVDETPVTVTNTTGCAGSVAETYKGGLSPTYTYSLTAVFA